MTITANPDRTDTPIYNLRTAGMSDTDRIWEIIQQAKAQMYRENKRQWDEFYPTYQTIRGKWLSEQPYVVVHRLAVADEMKQKGIATIFMQEVEKRSIERGIHSFKVDTNFDNLGMQKVLEKQQFTYCGEIFFQGDSRRAYEKLV